MPRQFCLGIFWFKFSLLLLPSGKGAHFLMIHTIALLAAVYLDLEFISSPAKLCQAQAKNRLHVGKAHFQYAICINALLRDTSVPLLKPFLCSHCLTGMQKGSYL